VPVRLSLLMTDKLLVFTTCASTTEAATIARRLVEQRVAACVSYSRGVTSVYRWKGALEESEEVALTVKTRRDLFPKLCAELRKVHPYECPEILALSVVDGSPDYMEWMERELQPATDS
jgi:periplasmic divalent cation tolerance protein